MQPLIGWVSEEAVIHDSAIHDWVAETPIFSYAVPALFAVFVVVVGNYLQSKSSLDNQPISDNPKVLSLGLKALASLRQGLFLWCTDPYTALKLPERPPCFSNKDTRVITIPRSTALHIS